MASVKFKGTPVTLAGKNVGKGERAPIVRVVAQDLSDVQIGGEQGVVQVVMAVPSLDTSVCAAGARKFNERAAGLANTQATVVSMDLPFAMGRFCTTEGIANLKVGSDFRNKEFAQSYGVLIADGVLAGLTARAVFVIDANGVIVHKELCDEITDEPDYDAALAAATGASATCCGS